MHKLFPIGNNLCLLVITSSYNLLMMYRFKIVSTQNKIITTSWLHFEINRFHFIDLRYILFEVEETIGKISSSIRKM